MAGRVTSDPTPQVEEGGVALGDVARRAPEAVPGRRISATSATANKGALGKDRLWRNRSCKGSP
ncbi:MAG: hypothetical protein ACRDL7_06240, partial [Gaiellaceae bacterium]